MEVHASPSPAAGVEVPKVLGMEFEEAVMKLRADGLEMGLVYARWDDRPLYSVIQQEPRPGSLLPKATPVTLILSLHQEPPPGSPTGLVRCKPEPDELDDPYCLGKLLKY